MICRIYCICYYKYKDSKMFFFLFHRKRIGSLCLLAIYEYHCFYLGVNRIYIYIYWNPIHNDIKIHKTFENSPAGYSLLLFFCPL